MGQKKPDHWYIQSGVIPFRMRADQLEVLLITSARKGNWIVPKGIVEDGFSPEESALKEALEEAGIVGHVVGDALGTYEHEKWGGICRIQVFAMRVEKELEHWPEENVRQRQWLKVDEAARVVAKQELAEMIEKLAHAVSPDCT